MHEKEFEQSVQQKLEDLSFAPSAPVWQQVEARIRAPRKKRRLIFWLLPLVIATGTAVWLYQEQGVTAPTKITGSEPNARKKSVEKSSPIPQNDNYPALNIKAADNKTAPMIAKENRLNLSSKNTRNNNSLSAIKNKGFVIPSVAENLPASPNLEQDSTLVTDVADTEKATMEPRVGESIATLSALRNQLLQNRQPDSALFKKIANTTKDGKSRWKWAVQVQYGRAWAGAEGRTAAGNLNFAADPAAAPAPAPPSGNVQATIKDGHYFSAAFLLRRSLGRSVSLSGGLQYSLYTQRIAVGMKRNLVAGSNANFNSMRVYEAGTSGGYYNNQFHMVSLPLALGVQPFHLVPLEAQLGIAPGYLFRNKALQYIPGTPYFTEVNPDVQKWQLPLLASLYYQLYSGKKFGLRGGPFLNMHLTGISNRNAATRRLHAGGASVQVQFK